jgi:tetratricopeptide (TPR) repeat protein
MRIGSPEAVSPSTKSNLPAPTLAFIVLAVMVALYGIDKFLAAQETSEMDQEASGHFAAGKKLLSEGKPRKAVPEFARAHAIDRNNREYLLSLATAELAALQLTEAGTGLEDVLEEDSNDGRANLLMARLMAKENHFKSADSYYHRAIYGEWPAGSTTQPAKVRLELAELLAKHGSSQELLSELLLLQNEPAQDLATRKRLAGLFLRAGSGERAADAYRSLTHDDGNDVDVFVGLGQAEIMAGNYRAAENAFLGALRRRMDDRQVQSDLATVAKLAALDPTVRRLSSAEKYRRSTTILALVQKELNACMPGGSDASANKIQGPINNEMAEARLDQAEKLWRKREEVCKQSPPADDPLVLLMKKLSQ